MSEIGSLADSAYEIINGTDGESQDGGLSESTDSLSVPRPDDVHSLDGSEDRYDTDSEEESDHSSHASSIRYADQMLESPSTHTQTNALRFGSTSTEGSGVFLGPIEFEEERDRGEAPKRAVVSAKYNIREFSDNEAAELAEQLDIVDPPLCLATTIRQTMSSAYLSTREPLRLLYIGRSEALRGIVLKISSAIWASPDSGEHGEDPFRGHREGVYNIVPISSFGPSPELDLMEASHYQIKVEHGISASEHRQEDDLHQAVTYSLTIGHDHDKTYSTVSSPEGISMRPQWALPHIAIFYCADEEDEHDEQTREAAWKFMKIHGVPCVFVSESQVIGKPGCDHWQKFMDGDAIRLCLESLDSKKSISPRWFPIDLASFTNIDARQMNRNLAFLTGLVDPESKTDSLDTKANKALGAPKRFGSSPLTPSWNQVIQAVDQNRWLVAVVSPVIMVLVASFLSTVMMGLRGGGSTPSVQQASLSSVLGTPTPTCLGRSLASTKDVRTSTTTVVINVTSTKTVQISHALPTTSTLASALSFAGFLSDRPSGIPTDPEPKKTVCAVRLYSPNELLVSIPAGSKASWLAKGAIDIDVYRGSEVLKTKLSSVDEGILVELRPTDAHGTLNVSVVTNRRPKINETFEVDVGKLMLASVFESGVHMLQDFANMLYTSVDEAVGAVEDAAMPDMTRLRDEAVSAWEQALVTGKNQYEDAVSRVRHSLGSNAQEARDAMLRHLQSAKHLRGRGDLWILKAQVASKLWWLKLQGKDSEFADYERNASVYLKQKSAEILLAGTEQGKDRRWRKMIMG